MNHEDDASNPLTTEPATPGSPFDPNNFHYVETPQLQQRRELVQHLVEYSSQIILVVGEPGIGKSAFGRQLVDRAPATWRVSRIVASLSSRAIDIVDQLLGDLDFGKPEQLDLRGYLTAVQRGLVALENADLVPLVLVDDAHQLTVEALAVLLDLAQGTATKAGESEGARLHIVMLSRSDVTRLFGTAELREHQGNIVHSLDLPRFTQQQTETFLGSLAEDAGIVINLSGPRLAEIQKNSSGIPGRVLNEARTATATAPEVGTKRRALFAGTRKGRLALAAIVLIGALATTLWLNNTKQLPESATITLALPSHDQVPHDQVADNQIRSGQVHHDELRRETATTSTSERKSPILKTNNETRAGSVPRRPEPSPAKPKVDKPLLDTDAADDPQQPALPPQATVATEVEARTKASAVASKIVSAQRKPSPAPAPAPSPKLPLKPPSAPVSVATRKPANVEPPAVTQTTIKLDHQPDHGWFRRQRATNYVLQLFGAHDPLAATRFIAGQSNLKTLKWFITLHAGKPWYVVCYGSYPDRDAARAAASALPPALIEFKAWARPIVDIQMVLVDP